MLRVTEIMYIVIAVMSLMEVIRTWGDFNNKFYIFLGFMLVSAVMYFVRRKQRIRMEEYWKQRENKE